VHTFDETSRETRSTPQGPLQAGHVSAVTFVIVAQKVQEPVQRQNPIFGRKCMPGGPSLTAGNASRNDHVAQKIGVPPMSGAHGK
jgi:hypothetical protein